jgi:WD40 repeat protein/serine/threonine protein kinase
MNDPEVQRNPVEELAEAFLERYRRGERPSLSEYTRQYPELAGEIRELFPALVMMEEAGPGRAGPAPAARVTSSGPPPERLGDYRILREVGRGGMGIVYEAEQEALGRRVALKVLPLTTATEAMHLQRFRREARSAARLHHTNIVPVFDVGEHQGIHYYAMQFIQGQALDAVLLEVKRLSGRTGLSGAASPAATGDEPPSNLTCALAGGLLTGQFRAEDLAAGGQGFQPPDLAGTGPGRPEAADTAGAAALPVVSRSPDRATPPESNTPPSDVLRSQSEFSAESDFHYYRSVARVGLQVAEALAFAHGQKVLHRDIKPSNLLLDLQGTVWVTDFGLAKGEGDDLTRTGDVVGTLRYMAPERFNGVSDPRSDVYSLGLTMYELLTLRPAFEESDRARLIKRLTHEEPPPPRRFDPRVPRDLETIVLKAIAKEPGQRYASAADLAEDLRRFLSDRPIQARPLGPAGRLARWCRRNPALAGVSGFAVAAGLAVLVVSVLFGLHQHRAAADLREERRQADQLSAGLVLEKALTLGEKGNVSHAQLWLAHGLAIAARAEDDPLQFAIRVNLAEWRQELHALELCLPHPDRVLAVAVSPDGKEILTGCQDGMARLWDAGTGRALRQPLRLGGAVHAVAFSRDGRLVVTAGGPTVQAWDRAGNPVGTPIAHEGNVLAIAFDPEGRWLATGCEGGTARVWDFASGKPVGPPLRHQGPVYAVAFHPDGQVIATGSADQTARLWKATTGEALTSPLQQSGEVLAVAFMAGHPALLLTGNKEWELRLWSGETGEDLGKRTLPQGIVTSLAVAADGATVVLGCADSRVAYVIDARTWRLRGIPLSHRGAVTSVAVFPGNHRVLTGGADGVARVWRLDGQPLAETALPQASPVRVVAYSPDGTLAATAAEDGTVQLWDPVSGRPVQPPIDHPKGVRALAFHPAGRLFFTGSEDGKGRFWQVADGKSVGPELVHPAAVRGAAFSPDGAVLLTGCEDGAARRWDVATGHPVGDPLRHKALIDAVAVSPDGRWLVTGSADRTAQLWDAATGQPAGAPLTHEGAVFAVAFSPDSRTVATGSDDLTARQWDVATQEPRGAALSHPRTPLGVAFHPNGRILATACHDGRIRFWEAATGKPVGLPRVHGNALLSLAFHPDGHTLMAGCWDRKAWLWRSPVAAAGDVERLRLWTELTTGMELDSAGAVRILDAAAWLERRRRLDELGGPPGP